jgi:transcriptional regulator with XRE-family HTH domain
MRTRVKEFRESRGWTVAELATRSGLSESQVNRIENDKREPSMESLQALASAFGCEVVDLLATTDAWQHVPMFGIIGDGGCVRPYENDDGPQTVKAPAAHGELLALLVESDSLYPRYLRGEIVLIPKTELADCADAVGKECLVYLPNGKAMLRFVQAGTKPNHFTLVAHNRPPMTDVSLVTCRPVLRP